MNDLAIFKYQEKEVRVVKDEQGDPWWVAKDVCDILSIIDTRTVIERLDLDEWGKTTVIDSMGRYQEAYIISESGLYEAIGRSNKPDAKVFQKWVRKEVLPSIRKHGKYESYPTDPRKLMALALIEAQKVIEEKDEQIAIMAPKADALDRISTADGSLCITNAAKDLQMRPKDLFLWLSSNKWIYRRVGTSTWIGYQEKIQTGYLEHKITTYSLSDGTDKITEQVRITARGIARIAQLNERKAA